jgi:hypothetical protein
MDEKHTLHIDLVKLADLAHTGVRRTAIFMGLGLHAAARDDFNDYQLGKLPLAPEQTEMLMDFFPQDLSAERVKEFKAEFVRWVISTGMRELIEHFALLLDKVHELSLTTLHNAGKLKELNLDKAHQRFHFMGFARKFETLESRFGIKVPQAASLSAFYLARNAFTHHFGFVGANHRSVGKDFLALTWNAFETVATGTDTGKGVPVVTLFGKKTTEPMEIGVRKVTRERNYNVGDRIQFSQRDLSEICAFFSMMTIPEAMQVFVDFLLANGVEELPKAS